MLLRQKQKGGPRGKHLLTAIIIDHNVTLEKRARNLALTYQTLGEGKGILDVAALG
jgi:hypothetical protein